MSDLGEAQVDAQAEEISAIACPVFATCFVVTSIADSGPGTLRQAILDANATAGDTFISFNIENLPPPIVILPVTQLPALNGDTRIAGYTQPGSARATDTTQPDIHIVINGGFANPGASGLVLLNEGNLVEGVAVNDFPAYGIVVNGTGNTVRGTMVGVDRAASFTRPNRLAGIRLGEGGGNLIGGARISDRNVVSGNEGQGIQIISSDNEVYGNAIGTDFDGDVALGNLKSGIGIYGSGGNEVGGTGEGERNIVAHNQEHGIFVSAGTENTLSQNLVHDNGRLGIDLTGDGVTKNDGLLDPDVGANDLQNFPGLKTALLDPSTEFEGKFKAEVDWQLKSEARTKYRVEFFASGECDPSNHGEGERFLGSRAIDTDATGLAENLWVLPGRVYPDEVITATATKFVRIDGAYVATSTSEFSKCLEVEFCSGDSCGGDGEDDPCPNDVCEDPEDPCGDDACEDDRDEDPCPEDACDSR
ncbi:MAG TPA: right-handed parallel beta-helix repeat-containing protein [Polyangiaceae bacterium]